MWLSDGAGGRERGVTPDDIVEPMAADRDWAVYLGDAASSQYSTLEQINTANVHQLEIAWVYRSGDAKADHRSEYG